MVSNRPELFLSRRAGRPSAACAVLALVALLATGGARAEAFLCLDSVPANTGDVPFLDDVAGANPAVPSPGSNAVCMRVRNYASSVAIPLRLVGGELDAETPRLERISLSMPRGRNADRFQRVIASGGAIATLTLLDTATVGGQPLQPRTAMVLQGVVVMSAQTDASTAAAPLDTLTFDFARATWFQWRAGQPTPESFCWSAQENVAC